MGEVDITLRAKNSSGDQRLWLTRDGDDFFFTLCGVHNGENIQIDFDDMSKSELLDLRTMIDLVIESV